MSNNVPLFACSKCFSKHPFEELSSGQQLCKNCRGAFPIVKCTYCRSEFQQTKGGKTDRMVTNWLSSGCHPNRSSVSQQLGARFCDVANEGGILSKTGTSTICNKCEHNVKQFGKPSACEYCNIIAAFIGNKCQRCTNSERKYGPPVTCEQCKQKCAFDRKDDDKKVDGKLLCWLCTLSYKRALAKTKHGDAGRRAQLQMAQRSNNNNKSRSENRIRSGSKRPSSGKPEVKVEGGSGGGGHRDGTDPSSLPPMVKAMRTNRPPGDLIDPNSSDHVVAMTQLKEQLVSLQKQISQKDSQLLAKDRMITELKAKNFTSENELRNKMQSTEREFDKKVDLLSNKIKSLRKEVATLTKSNKKTVISSGGGVAAGGGGGSGGSGTDSPLP